MTGSETGLLIVMALMTLANLAVLGLTLKLYTEWFKDRAISARGKS